MNEESIDEIKQKRLQKLMQQQNETLKLQKQLGILEQNIKKHMSQEAYSRYSNIKLAHPKKAIHVLILINQAIETKKVAQIDDSSFKQLLKQLQNNTEFRIKRK
jgi:DNA-binding TFAR19-related protein (PDSD5 family)